MIALLTIRTTASIGADQCAREATLLRDLGSRLYDYIGDAEDPLLQRAELMASEWERLVDLCKRREADEQVDTER